MAGAFPVGPGSTTTLDTDSLHAWPMSGGLRTILPVVPAVGIRRCCRSLRLHGTRSTRKREPRLSNSPFAIERSEFSGDDAQLPRHEFVLSVTVHFTFRRDAGRTFEHALEDRVSELRNRDASINYAAAIDVHIVFLFFPQRCIRCKFQEGRWSTQPDALRLVKALFAAPAFDLSSEAGPTRTPQGQETHFIQPGKIGGKTHVLKAWG